MSCCRFARQLFSVSCCFNACSPAPFDVRSRHIFHTPVIPILCRQGSVQQKIAHRRLASRPGLLTATPIFGRKSSLPLPASRTAEKNRAAALRKARFLPPIPAQRGAAAWLQPSLAAQHAPVASASCARGARFPGVSPDAEFPHASAANIHGAL